MKRAVTVATAVGVVAISGAAIFAAAGGKNSMCSNDASSCDPAACETEAKTAVAKPTGKVLGHFDLAMAGCRFACATKSKYDAKAVVAQPGGKEGKLTQCPVSGVVFNVDAKRPHVRVGADDYVTCCDTCAEKLRKNPRRFVRA
jgi:TRASH domain-containing protein